MLVATRHSAAAYKPVPPGTGGGLLIADECHGLGGGILRRALLPQYEERLGLTATLERSDDAVTDLLLPYFGGICYRYGFEQAIADGVCARPARRVRRRRALRSTNAPSTSRSSSASSTRASICAPVRDMPLDPFGDFLAAVAHLAERDAGADGRAARDYLDAFSKRRQIVAQTIGKYELLGSLAPAIKDADGALVFTETVRAANHAINRLDPLVVDRPDHRLDRAPATREILDDLRVRKLDAVAAPRVLDEGIDVPDANLGVVMSASRTRRQMIQRMGRILRRKRAGDRRALRDHVRPGHARGSGEPHRTRRLPRRDRAHLGSDRRVRQHAVRGTRRLPRRTGPPRSPSPSTSSATAGSRPGRRSRDAYALLAFTRVTMDHAARRGARAAGRQLPTATDAAPRYLEVSLSDLPRVAKPKVAPKRLSTGELALEIARVGDGWRISCTGCGEASPLVQFRWQVLDQTVPCRCS